MTLLTIISDAATELNVTPSTNVIASSDPSIKQLLALANKEGKELARRFDWQILTNEATFATVATETQVASVTTTFPNFLRIVNGSMWNRSQFQPVRGPYDAAKWQQRKSTGVQTGFGNAFRIRGGALLFHPNPAAGENIYFEYISDKWCQSTAAVLQDAWAADDDVAILDEEIIRLGIVWRWRKAKGLDYGEDFRTYESALEALFGPDAGSSVVDMTGDEVMANPFVPDGNWAI